MPDIARQRPEVGPIAQSIRSPHAVSGARTAMDDPFLESDRPFVRWTAEQAEALRRREPSLSPWWVVAAQVAAGVVVAVLAAALGGRAAIGWSLFYGSLCVAVPAALMARGMTSPLARLSPAASAVSFMAWEMVKIAVSIVMLAVAGRIVQPLVWPALIGGLVLGLKVYWLALLVRRRPAG